VENQASPPSRQSPAFDLIVTIVNRGGADDVIAASRKAGAEGGTCLLGRGIGIHEKAKFLGIPIEPAKDIVLTITPEERTDTVLESIRREVQLDKPGHGIGFVIGLKKVVGIAHLAE